MASSARIEELERKFNENPRRYFAPLANEYRKAGDLEQAIAICRTYVPQQPAHMSGHIVFGQALFEAGEHEEARGVFEAALALDPENLIALRHLGDIARERGEASAARTWYQRVLDADPRNEEVLALVGSIDGAAARTSAADIPTWAEINPERTLELPPALLESATREAALGQGAPSGGTAAAPRTATPRSAFEQTLQPPPPTVPRAGWPHDTPVLADEIPGPGLVDVEPLSTGEGTAPGETADGEPSHVASDATEPTPGLEPMEFTAPPEEQSASAESVAYDPAPDTAPAVFVTETMAELYLQQGFREEALNVYRQLLAQNPADALLQGRVEELEREVAEAAAANPAGDRHPIGLTIRSFFAALATREWTGAEFAPAPDFSSTEYAAAAEFAPPPIADYAESDDAPAVSDGVAVVGDDAGAVESGVELAPPESGAESAPAEIAAHEGASVDAHAEPVEVESEPAADAGKTETPVHGDHETGEDPSSAVAPNLSIASPTWTAAAPSEPAAAAKPSATETSDAAEPSAAAADPVAAASSTPTPDQSVEIDDPHAIVLDGGGAPGRDKTVLGGFRHGSTSPLSEPGLTEYDVASYDAADMFGTPAPAAASTQPMSSSSSEPAAPAPDLAPAVEVEASVLVTQRDAEVTPDAASSQPDTETITGGSSTPSPSAQELDAPIPAPASAETEARHASELSTAGEANGSAPIESPRKAMQTGSVNVLFPQDAVRQADETAAATLSDAFGGPTQSGAAAAGRPARPANNELSLDSIFREAGPPPEARRESSAFSFDQFFTDAPGKPAPAAPATGTAPRDSTVSDAPDALSTDAEQFSNWLAGLKKK